MFASLLMILMRFKQREFNEWRPFDFLLVLLYLIPIIVGLFQLIMAPKKQEEFTQHYYVGNSHHYYNNLLNALILYTLSVEELKALALVLINPIDEKFDELNYAFTPVCFDTLFRTKIIKEENRLELLDFYSEVNSLSKNKWNYEAMSTDPIWNNVRIRADEILRKLGVDSRIYDTSKTIIFDEKGKVIYSKDKEINN